MKARTIILGAVAAVGILIAGWVVFTLALAIEFAPRSPAGQQTRQTLPPEEKAEARREAAKQVPLATLRGQPAPAPPQTAALASTTQPSPTAVDAVELLQAFEGKVPLASLGSTPPAKPAGRTLAVAKLNTVPSFPPPPLEADRVAAEKLLTPEQDTVKIVTGFECSTPLKINKLSATHFEIEITTESFRNWFLFKVEGAAGKTVRIDIKNAPVGKWWSLNPVYSYAASLDALETFETALVKDAAEPKASYSGPLLPDTRGQKWSFVENVWSGEETLRFVQRFEQDSAFVSMKYPYTPKYNEAFLDSLKGKSGVTVHNLGASKEGRPLRLVEIGDGDRKTNPCILMYAREHATEHDTSWAAEGAIRFLMSDDPKALDVRQKMTVLVLPFFDLDGAAVSQFSRITDSFADGRATPESLAVSAWLKKWVDQGHRLDLVFNLHNVESGEAPHLICPMMELETSRFTQSVTLHNVILGVAGERGYGVAKNASPKSYTLFRLGGFASRFYSALHMPYEVNSQASSRHLSLEELRKLGELLIISGQSYLLSTDGEALRTEIDKRRHDRHQWWELFGGDYAGTDAIRAEHWVRVKGMRKPQARND